MADDVTNRVEKLESTIVAMGGSTQQLSKNVDLIKTSWQRFGHAVNQSLPFITTIKPMAKWISNLGKVATEFSDDSKDMEDATNNLTIAQKHLIMPLVKSGLAAKAGAKMNEIFRDSVVDSEGNTRGWVLTLIKLSSAIFTLVGILAIVGFAIATFSLGVQGMSSPLISLAQEHAPFLVEALKGIVGIINGDMTLSFRSLQGVLLLFGAALLVLPGFFAPFFVAIMIGIGLFRKFRDEGVGWKTALINSAMIAFGFLIGLLKSGSILKLVGKLVFHILKFVGLGRLLILAGLALLWKSATGQIKGAMGDFAAVVGAGMVYIGLIMLKGMGVIGATIGTLPLFWVAALLLVVVLIARHHKAIKAKFYALGSALWEWAKGLGANLANAIMSPIRDTLDWIRSKLGGGGGGTFEITSLAGPMADGGPVRSGRTYLVGERGPELFSPRSSGNIVPNEKLGGATNQNITLNIDVGGVTDRTDKRALAREIGDMLNQEMRRLGGSPTRGRY